MRILGTFVKFMPPQLLGVVCLVAAGCAHTPIDDAPLSPTMTPHAAQLPQQDIPVEADAEAPESLDDLLHLATSRHPELRAARARVEAAQGALIQAGLYPNPIIGPGFKEIGHRENAWGEIGLNYMQQIVRARKLQWAQAAATEGLTAADWEARTRWFAVATRVRLAYVEYLAAQRERDTIGKIEKVAGDFVNGLKKLEQSGAGVRPDVLRAETEYEQQAVKKNVVNARIAAARRALAAEVGMANLNLDNLRGDLDKAPPQYAWDELVEWTMNLSAELREARAMVAQREMMLQQARANAVPDIMFSAMPFYTLPDQQWRAEINVTAAVPIYNRNEGNIIAAKAELARARANEEMLALRLRERLAAAYQRFEAGQALVDAYRKKIVPKAAESLKLVQTGHDSGATKYDFIALLQARQVLFAAELAGVQALTEWQRAAAELAGIAQLEDWRDVPRNPK